MYDFLSFITILLFLEKRKSVEYTVINYSALQNLEKFVFYLNKNMLKVYYMKNVNLLLPNYKFRSLINVRYVTFTQVR